MLFKNLPLQLLLCLVFVGVGGNYVPLEGVRAAYTISLVFKELLLAFLPFVIFSYISSAILSLDKKAPLWIFAIIALVTFSNAFNVFVSYGVARLTLPFLQTQTNVASLHSAEALIPYFSFSVPKLISADKIMVFAVFFGILFSFFKVQKIADWSLQLQQLVTRILVRGFIPFLPLYILGFTLKMKREGGLEFVFTHYGAIFLLLCSLLAFYISFAYWLGNGLRVKSTVQAIRTMLPAGVTGFSTMSSAVTMPVTLTATKKNIEDPNYAQLVIPTTVNIHMMGDALSVPILTFGVMHLFGQPLPSFAQFAMFVPAFCLAKFSLAAIPGGTIIVMLPVLQAHFGLSPETASLITTLYILQDPLFTCGNVMGNGAFAILSYRLICCFKQAAFWHVWSGSNTKH